MKLFRRLRYWMRSSQNQADLAEEMAFHQDMLGDAPAMGNRTLAREDARAVWIWPWLESVVQDVRYALRNLGRQPGFALIAILALGCAIGLNTSLFTIFDAVAIRPWPVHDPAHVVNVIQLNARNDASGFSLEEYRYLGAHTRTTAGLIAHRGGPTVRIPDGKAVASWVSGNYFGVLGVTMQQGRGFRADEDIIDAPQPVVVLSYGFWENHLGADPNAIGKQIRIEETPFIIVGVAGSDFTGTSPQVVDMYVPMAASPLLLSQAAWLKDFLHSPTFCCSSVAARLGPGISREQAHAELAVLHQQFNALRHEESHGVELTSTAFLARDKRVKALPVFLLMFLGVTLVLLLACANVGNLLLARAAARQREISVRLSVGASRIRVVRQLLTESLVLASLSGALGVAAAYWLPALVVRYAVDEGIAFRLQPDAVVLAYALALSVGTCLAFGLAPALHGTRSGGIRSRFSLRSVLLTTQVALSVILLVGAGLMTRAVEHARTTDPGFRVAGVSIATFDLPANSYDAPRARAFFSQLSRDLSVDQLGLTRLAPLGNSRSWTAFRLPGETDKQRKLVVVHEVNAGYFDVLGIPILEGRVLSPSDTGRQLLLVNQSLARRYFDNQALGKTVVLDKPFEIVGVVKDAYTSGLDEVSPTMYFPMGTETVPVALFRATPGSAEAITAVAKQIDIRAGVTFTPLSVNFEKSLQASRTGAAIAEVLGIFALALATIGMFGVFAYWVEQRTKEIGIRMALGARPKQVIRLVLSGNSRAILIGLALGFAGSAAASRLLQKFLYGLSPFDPISYSIVAAILAAAAVAATFLPARKATKIDPLTALRCE